MSRTQSMPFLRLMLALLAVAVLQRAEEAQAGKGTYTNTMEQAATYRFAFQKKLTDGGRRFALFHTPGTKLSKATILEELARGMNNLPGFSKITDIKEDDIKLSDDNLSFTIGTNVFEVDPTKTLAGEYLRLQVAAKGDPRKMAIFPQIGFLAVPGSPDTVVMQNYDAYIVVASHLDGIIPKGDGTLTFTMGGKEMTIVPPTVSSITVKTLFPKNSKWKTIEDVIAAALKAQLTALKAQVKEAVVRFQAGKTTTLAADCGFLSLPGQPDVIFIRNEAALKRVLNEGMHRIDIPTTNGKTTVTIVGPMSEKYPAMEQMALYKLTERDVQEFISRRLQRQLRKKETDAIGLWIKDLRKRIENNKKKPRRDKNEQRGENSASGEELGRSIIIVWNESDGPIVVALGKSRPKTTIAMSDRQELAPYVFDLPTIHVWKVAADGQISQPIYSQPVGLVSPLNATFGFYWYDGKLNDSERPVRKTESSVAKNLRATPKMACQATLTRRRKPASRHRRAVKVTALQPTMAVCN